MNESNLSQVRVSSLDSVFFSTKATGRVIFDNHPGSAATLRATLERSSIYSQFTWALPPHLHIIFLSIFS
jgi:hypothetical protein